MKKIKLLLVFVLILTSHSLFSQDFYLPSQKKYSVGNQIAKTKSYINGSPFEVSLGYTATQFNNPVFKDNLTSLFGYNTSLKYNKLFPFIFELSYSNSILDVKNTYFNYQQDDKISFSTVGGGVSLALLPNSDFRPTLHIQKHSF